nr:response regulator transcription factor [uncultured Nocardioides sp.]
MLDVLVADDHEVIRFGLTTLLSSAPDMRVVGVADNGADAVELARRLHPDVVVMDLSMPVLDGISATEQVLKASPDTRVLVVSVFSQPDVVEAAIAAGAHGYLDKSVAAEDVVDGIRFITQGQRILPRRFRRPPGPDSGSEPGPRS